MINENFLKLSNNYLFAEIGKRVREYKAANPDKQVISLGIGDVTQPLPAVCIEAMHRAVEEMAAVETFRGYGPEQGYEFLRRAIVENDYAPRGINLSVDEVFVSDGAKSDCGNIGDILSPTATVAVLDPVYPVYIDSNIMTGRQVALITDVPTGHIDIIYLCYPNNPTGAVLTREQLGRWVEYALREKSLILFDAAYESYIRHSDIPHSIYEIQGAERCAIELRSFSKTAGFTGIRCGYTIVPRALTFDVQNYTRGQTTQGTPSVVSLNHLWLRRQCTKFNGASYITQCAAAAIYTEEGKRQVREMTDYYMRNASYLKNHLLRLGYDVSGGEDAPYIWLRVPEGYDSWSFFDHMLLDLSLVVTPGVGFGPAGEGYVRLTAFGRYEDCLLAIERMSRMA